MVHAPMERMKILTKEAGKLLDLTPNSVRVLARNGELPAERIGTINVYERSVVQRMAKARTERRRQQSARTERLAG